jgi:hypothetical protein
MMLVLSDLLFVFLSLKVVLPPNVSFWIVPLLHSVSDMTVQDIPGTASCRFSC